MSNPSYRPEGVRCIYEALSGHVILARPCDEANAVILLNSTLAAMDAAVEKMEADTKRAMEALDEAKDAVTKCEEEAAAKDAENARLRKALEEIANSPGRSFHIERIAKAALGETPREFETIFACRPVEGSEK